MNHTIRCHAKTNLILRVGPVDSDGFHRLFTVYQTLSLHDRLTLALSDVPGICIRCNREEIPTDERNLAWQAAERMLAAKGCRVGVTIDLEKRIPAGGGLGGGSSNAAGVLMALNQMLGRLVLPADDLLALAREIGSDVPFFLVGGTALGIGRGEQVVPMPDLPTRSGYLLIPPVSFPTGTMYDHLDRQSVGGRSLVESVPAELYRSPEAVLENDFHQVVDRADETVAGLLRQMSEAGHPAILSGSGATVLVLGSGAQPAPPISGLPDDWQLMGVTFAGRDEVPHVYP